MIQIWVNAVWAIKYACSRTLLVLVKSVVEATNFDMIDSPKCHISHSSRFS